MPFENFTTYTEEDPLSRLTVTSSKVTCTQMRRDDDCWVVKDKGTDHFDSDFEHLLKAEYTEFTNNTIGGWQINWMLANLAGTFYDIRTDNSDDCLQVDTVWYNAGSQIILILTECVAGTPYSDGSGSIAEDTPVYLRVKRDEGVGTYGTLYGYVYSDAARTTLEDTMVLTLHEKEDFRYIYGMNSFGEASAAQYISGYTENLDLQEAVGRAILNALSRAGNLFRRIGFLRTMKL